MSPEVLKQVRSGVILLQTSMQPDFFLQPRDIPPAPAGHQKECKVEVSLYVNFLYTYSKPLRPKIFL